MAGNRPSTTAHVKLGATKDGKLVALTAETHGTGGRRLAVPAPLRLPGQQLHEGPHRGLRQLRRRPAMRAPGHPQGCA